VRTQNDTALEGNRHAVRMSVAAACEATGDVDVHRGTQAVRYFVSCALSSNDRSYSLDLALLESVHVDVDAICGRVLVLRSEGPDGCQRTLVQGAGGSELHLRGRVGAKRKGWMLLLGRLIAGAVVSGLELCCAGRGLSS
jgi:hypothetical protein